MNGALSIALRDVHERRMVLAAALVAGLLPFASPLLPGVSAARAGEARDVMAVVLALGFGLILALLLGASAIARDLAENRLGFDFARPVGGLAIWGGRLGAAAGLTIATMAIIVAPAALVGGWLHRIVTDDPESSLLFLGAVLLAVGLAHAASVAIRSRSRWLLLDLAGLVVVPLLAVIGIRGIVEAGASLNLVVAVELALIAAIASVWIASALQVVHGRTDLVAGHRVQSIALWSMLLVIALGLAGYSVWLVRADLSDLEAAWALTGPDGNVVQVAGTTTGREIATRFLLDVETGRSLRIGTRRWFDIHEVLFSRDGRRAVVLHRASATAPTIDVLTVDLAAPALELRETTLGFAARRRVLRPALSPTGRRLATLQGRNLSVHDLDSGRILAAAQLEMVNEDPWRDQVAFAGEDRVRVYAFSDRLVAYELDVPGRKIASWTGPEIERDQVNLLRWRHDHERLILRGTGAIGSILLDGRSGATLAQLAPAAQPDDKADSRSSFLADGRIVRLAWARAGRATLELVSPDGEPLRSFDLGPTDARTYFVAGGEVAPGTITLARGSRGRDGEVHAGRLMLCDVETGRIRDVEGGGFPIVNHVWVFSPAPVRPGSVASRLIARDRAVWLLDPDSATLRLVAGRPS